jgi:PIN domain nuclease of toxin-antitoxin system
MQAPLLDTHAWIWYAGDQSRLDAAELDALDRFDIEARPLLSDFSLWEIATLVSRGRLTLDQPLDRWLSLATRRVVVRMVPVSVAIAVELAGLPDTFHRDPADRVIVATARALRMPNKTSEVPCGDGMLADGETDSG